MSRNLWILLLTIVALGACSRRPSPQPVADPGQPVVLQPPVAPAANVTPTAAAALPGPVMDRVQWNFTAAALNLPLFEQATATGGRGEIAVLWRADQTRPMDEVAVAAAVALVDQTHGTRPPPAANNPPEELRRAAVQRELSQGRPTLLVSDFTADGGRNDGTVAMVRHVLAAAAVVERLYARQSGVVTYGAQIPVTDLPSRALFARNQGPWCEAPLTENDPNCAALADHPTRTSGLYPLDVQADKKFCEVLAARKDGPALMAPFSAVQRDAAGELVAVPYQVAYATDMAEVATELQAAATALTDPAENALRAYLRAAAQAFRDGDWPKADEAWAAMTVDNSRFYLRIGPDETYHEPCSQKAGFHVSFARIDQASRKWQQLLDPVKNDMEQALAALAGPPYKARTVAFHLPDFIEIILNAGDSRSPFGATIGQSLPNWGPVANQGRGRTVAMVNIGTDPDSRKTWSDQAASVLCPKTFAVFTTDPEPQRMSTVLHEAAHNLGPAHEYMVKGQKDGQVFGGPLAATLEELKAQTAAMFLADWLVGKGLLPAAERDKSHISDMVWAMGHISNGMVDAQGKPKPYSQLAAIQVGALQAAGALKWRENDTAANGQDLGCFEADLTQLPIGVAALMKRVAGIKARGDKADAEKLSALYVASEGPFAALRETIRSRWLRAPKASYVYSIKLPEPPHEH